MKYKVNILRVLDGDTVDVLFNFPFGIQVKKRVRLFGINAPETRTRDLEEKRKGILAKERLAELLKEAEMKCVLVYHGDGKFGRRWSISKSSQAQYLTTPDSKVCSTK